MTAVLVACPVSRCTVDLLAAQLRELQPVTRLVAVPQCISEAHNFTSLTKCSPTEDSRWSQNASSALQDLLQGEDLSVVVIDAETWRSVQQTGRNSAMKVFTVESQGILAVVTASEGWKRLCWQGRVETVHKSVLRVVQSQVNEGLKAVLTVWEQLKSRQIEELNVHFQSKFQSSVLAFDSCVTKIEALVQHIRAQEMYCIQAIERVTEKFDAVMPLTPLYEKPQVQLNRPVRPSRPAPKRVAPESLSQDWQARICKLEHSLGEQLSQEALAVLTNSPGADFLSDADLIVVLLGSV